MHWSCKTSSYLERVSLWLEGIYINSGKGQCCVPSAEKLRQGYSEAGELGLNAMQLFRSTVNRGNTLCVSRTVEAGGGRGLAGDSDSNSTAIAGRKGVAWMTGERVPQCFG